MTRGSPTTFGGPGARRLNFGWRDPGLRRKKKKKADGAAELRQVHWTDDIQAPSQPPDGATG